MLQDAGRGARVFLHAEPSNPYDKCAYKVLIWKDGKMHHVGYVQRHFASKIAAVMQGSMGFDNRKTYLAGMLHNEVVDRRLFEPKADMFEVVIGGAITDVQGLIKREANIKNDTGIDGRSKKKGFFDEDEEKCKADEVSFRKADIDSMKYLAKTFVRDACGYLDHDIDRELFGYIDEADCF